jgi:hypothetical protein
MAAIGDPPAHFLRDHLHDRNERVIQYCLTLHVFRFTKEKCVLLITESSISLFPLKTLQQGVKPSFFCDCFSITQIEVPDSRIVILSVDSLSITLEFPSAPQFVQHLYGHLGTILTDSEMPKFVFKKFRPIDVPVPVADRIISRLRARAFLQHAKIPKDFELTLRHLVTYGNTFVDFARFPYPEFFDFIFDSLIFATQVNAISLPYSVEPHWAGVAEILRRNPWIRTITTAEVADDSFECLTENVPPVILSNVQHITFKTLLRSRHISIISQVSASYRIPSLTISHYLSGAHVSIIIKTFSTIRSLTLDHVDGFDHYDTALRSDSQIEELGITYSSLNITWFLLALERHTLPIKRLNLSGNHTARVVAKPFVFPDNFECLIANDVEFQVESFMNLFKALLEIRKPLSVSLSYLRGLPPEDIEIALQAIITRLPSTRSGDSITEFCWDENPVTPSLIQLLERLSQLRILSVRGISNESAVLIAGYLRGKPPVRELRIGGTRVAELAIDGFLGILRALKEGNRILEKIDVRMVSFTEIVDALQALLLGNRVIRELVLDCCDLQEANGLILFLESLMGRGVSLKVQLPATDLEWMSRARIMVADLYAKLTRLVMTLAVGNPGIVIPPETVELPEVPGDGEEEDVPGAEDVEDVEVTRPPPVADPGEWDIEIQPPPPTDNGAIWAAFQDEFSFPALLSHLSVD